MCAHYFYFLKFFVTQKIWSFSNLCGALMSFHLECKDFVMRANTSERLAEQRSVWSKPCTVSGLELQWHLNHLAKHEIECECPAVWFLIALSSINAWSKMSLAIPWLGRYALCPGVSFRVMYYFSNQMPIYKSHDGGCSRFSRSFNGRLHGLQASVWTVKVKSARNMWDSILFPWQYTETKHAYPLSKMSMVLWDRGRKVRFKNFITEIAYGNPMHLRNKFEILWGKRRVGQITKLDIRSYLIYSCISCERQSPEIIASLQGRDSSYVICPECHLVAPWKYRYARNMLARFRESFDLKKMGLDESIPLTPLAAMERLSENARKIADMGEFVSEPPVKRYFPGAAEMDNLKRHKAESLSGKQEKYTLIS